MTVIKKCAVALAATLVAAGLTGCASAPVPGSVEEQLWFDKAQGQEIHKISPELRFRGLIGYPRSDFSRRWPD